MEIRRITRECSWPTSTATDMPSLSWRIWRDAPAQKISFGSTDSTNNHWVGARKVWNQANYHVTNVNDSGFHPAI